MFGALRIRTLGRLQTNLGFAVAFVSVLVGARPAVAQNLLLQVNAGPDTTIAFQASSATAALNGTVSPNDPLLVGYIWNAPDGGTLHDPTNLTTSISFTHTGLYRVVLSAWDISTLLDSVSDTCLIQVDSIPAITSTLTASGTVGTPFTYTITASGTTPITFSTSTLPAGLSVDPASGVISGTPTASGTTNVTLSANNAAGGAPTKTLVLTISLAPTITNTTLSASDTIGVPFSYAITATGTAPITYGAAPLPAGLSVNTGTGVISGTPTATGTTNVTLSAINAAGSAPAKTLILTVYPATAPTITSASTAGGTAGAPFSYTITASGTAPITFSTSPLPTGLTVSTTTGLISGTPTVASTYSDTLYAHNAAGDATPKVLILTISPAAVAPTITNTTLTATGTAGTAFSYTITATGTAPITYGASPLPTGLTVSTTTGLISGIPTVAGTYNDTLYAHNAVGDATPKVLVLTVTPAPVPPAITSALTASGTAGTTFSYTITASGTTPITFNALPLPAGLSIDSSSGKISGTPAAAGTTSVTLSAHNTAGAATPQTLVLTIAPAPVAPTITSTLSAGGTAGTAFSYTITATGTAPITFGASPLPAGLSVNATTGAISGTPTATGTTNVTLSATNTAGAAPAKTLVITVSAATVAPTITNTVLSASDTVGAPFSYTITATGTSPITFGAAPLPTGLSINTATGSISGTPTASGTTSVALSASNAAGVAPTKTLTLTIYPAVAPTITSALTAGGTAGAAFSYTITASGSKPITFGAAPLPTGLSVNASTGLISGTPTGAGTTNVTLSAANAAGAAAAKTLVITISSAPVAPTITNTNLSTTGTAGVPLSYTIAAIGTAPITFGAAPLPAGLSVNTTTGVISGTPTATGTTNVTLSATNSIGAAPTKTLALSISAAPVAPVINSPTTVTATTGQSFNYTITASGTQPITFGASPLPAGLSVNSSTGAISGTPTTSGITNVTLSATNAAGAAPTKTLVMTISSASLAPSITSALTTSSTAGTAFSYTITASGTQPITFGASPLPAGLSINSSSGLISGTPTATGITNVTLSAANTTGQDTKTLVLTLTAQVVPPIITTAPASQTVTVGQAVLLTAAVAGTSPFTYQWQKDSVNIAGATGDTLTFASVGSGDAGRYRIVVRNAASVGNDSSTFAVSPFAALTVNLPKVATPKVLPRDTSFYPTLSVALSCDTVGAVIRYTTDGTSPTSTSAVYSQPLVLTATTSVKAVAFKSGETNSDMLTAVYNLTPPNKTAPPMATPTDTNFTTSVQIALSSPTPGAVIYYTLDGSIPGQGTTTIYSAPFWIYQTTTVKAVATVSGLSPSDTLTLTYHLQQSLTKVATPVATPSGERFHNSVGVQLFCATDSASIWYTTDSTDPLSSSTRKQYSMGLTLVLSQTTVLKAAATRLNWQSSDLLTQTYSKAPGPIVCVPGQDTTFASTLTVTLTVPGNFPIYYTADGSAPIDPQFHESVSAAQYLGPIHLTASATLVAVAMDGDIPSDTLTRFFTKLGSALPPPGALPSGQLFADTVIVTLKPPNAGAAVYYTTNGAIPTAASSLYSQPLRFDTTVTLQAISVQSGYLPSQVLIENYVLAPDTPSVHPPGGQYFGAVQITLSDASPKAGIYYTLDGSTPVPGTAFAYTGPFTLQQSSVLKAAAAAGSQVSATRTLVYNISARADTVIAPGGTFATGGYAFYNPGAAGFSARVVLAPPDTVSAPGIASIPFAMLLNPAAPGQPFPGLQFTKPASDARALYVIGPDGRIDFVSAADSVAITASGIYFLGLDTVPPTVTFINSVTTALDSVRANFVVNDNVANILYSLQRSDDPRRDLSQVAAETPDTVHLNLKNPAGVLAPLYVSFTVSDHTQSVRFPADGTPWYLAQHIAATQSPAVLHIGATPAYPWDLISFPVQAEPQPSFGQIAAANHIASFGVFSYRSAGGQYVAGGNGDTLVAGRGYWVGASAAFSSLWLPALSLQAPAVPVHVHLDSGWNLIGDPLPQTLYWPMSRTSTAYRLSTVKGLWAFDSGLGDYTPSDSLEPWRGYFVYSYARDTTVELTTSPSAAAKPAAASNPYAIVLDYGHRSLELGMFPDAKTGLGVEDESTLPALDSQTAFASLRQGHWLQSDYLPLQPDSLAQWEVVVRGASASGPPLGLGSVELPAGVRAWLVAPQRHLKLALDSRGSAFQPAPGADTVWILAGPAAALAKSGIFVAAKTALPAFSLQLFPAGRNFLLDLNLPSQARLAARLVTVDGRTAEWMPARWMEAGRYTLSLDHDFQGHSSAPLPRGIYFLWLRLQGEGLPAQWTRQVQIIE